MTLLLVLVFDLCKLVMFVYFDCVFTNMQVCKFKAVFSYGN